MLDFVEVQQRSSIEARLQVLRELHDRARQTGELSATDWQRLAGAEHDLETQLRAVRRELANRLSNRNFGRNPKADASEMNAIKPARIAELTELHRMLIGGLRGWNELLVLHKFAAGELTDGEVEAVIVRVSKLADQHQELVGLIDSVIDRSKRTRARNPLQRLFTDGLLIGASNDERHMKTVRAGRKALQSVRKSAAAAPPKSSARPLLADAKEPAELPPLALDPCPQCGSQDVNAIWYGLVRPPIPPNVTPGGCVVTDQDPDRWCRVCGHSWATPPPLALG